MIHDAERLQQLLGRPALRRLLDRLRRRVRLGQDLYAPVTLSDLSPEERSAVCRLLGRRPSAKASIRVQPAEVESVLRRANICDQLQEALIHLLGPIANERQARESIRQAWSGVRAAAEPELAGLGSYQQWFAGLFASGRVKRWCGGDPDKALTLLRQTLAMIGGVPWPIIPLADLAARLTGDSHALDRGTPLSQICRSAIESQQPLGEAARSRRQLWEWAGVVIDELSAPVLTLNLRADPATLIGQMLNLMADAGEPCHLSVRLLRLAGASAFAKAAEPVVFACENPSVVAAAAHRLGRRSAPLICTAGQPASAAQMLLSLLQQSGRRVRYHGDCDYPGVSITNLLIQRFGVEPWRMSANEIAAANVAGPALAGVPVAATWDPCLTPRLTARGQAILEESVLDELLVDLSTANSSE